MAVELDAGRVYGELSQLRKEILSLRNTVIGEQQRRSGEDLLDRYIEITPGVRGGKPRIAGTRITVADIKVMHLELEQSLEEIAEKYDLPLAGVYAAMAYYFDHRDEIDRGIEDGLAFAESLKEQYPSLLAQKLSHSQ